MSGWKTWLAVVAGLTSGAYQIIIGNYNEGIVLIMGALALLGIGGKLDKIVKK